MGADKQSNVKKCGEILIDINRARNRNNKMYTYNCTLCECLCDQLKKFTLHLEEKHFPQFIEETDDLIQADFKLEDLVEVELKTENKNDISPQTPATDVVREDPLDTVALGTTSTIVEELTQIKLENEEDGTEQKIDFEDDINDEMDFNDCFDANNDDSDEDFQPTKKKCKTNHSKEKKPDASDVSSDDSNGELFAKKRKSTKPKNKSEPTDPTKVDDKELTKALLKAFKKQTILWNLKERTNVKNVSQKCFETIADEVNGKLNAHITWKFAKLQINAMRRECSYELEKERNGEAYEMPWYFEHMNYLQENIDYMIKERNWKFGKRVKKLDLSILPTIIELYKKYNDIWQVNNINFGIAAKKDEALKKMMEDLKQNYNLNISFENVQYYIKYLNRFFTKDKEQQLKCELEKSEFKPSFQYYEELSFLTESQGPFKCAICNEIIQRYEIYHIHLAAHHNTKPFNCPLCKMGFKTFDTYVKHAKRHLSITSFPCKICGKIYPVKTELERHLIGHTGEKPFLCQICGSSFRVSRDYDNHIRRHEKRFRYECHICKHGFNQLVSLNDHVKAHLKIRDFFCNICGKGFTTEKYLRNHKLIHDEIKRFKCQDCDKEYAQLAGLRQHRKTHGPRLSAAQKKLQRNESMLDMTGSIL